MVKLRVWARVTETEDPEKVKRAILNIFPGTKLDDLSAGLVVDDLKALRRLIKVKRIGKTVVGQLVRNLVDDKTNVFFHKQAAFVEKLAFVEKYEDSPGGAIVLEINWDVGLVSWLTGVEKSQLVEMTRH